MEFNQYNPTNPTVENQIAGGQQTRESQDLTEFDQHTPITEDQINDIRQAENIFEKQAREKPQELEEIYSKFEHFLFNTHFKDGYENDPILHYLYHKWANTSGSPTNELIDIFRQEKTNDIFEKIIRRVKLTSQLFEILEKFSGNENQSLYNLFQKEIDLARTTDTHQIITLGGKLLSEIESIQPGHKTINFIIFSTLLENAQKFSPQNSTITIKISKESRRLRYDPKKHPFKGKRELRYYVSVSDEGIGIPKKDQKRVLEKSERGSNVSNIPGTGFGLSLVYELCNHRITITSPLHPEAKTNKGTKIKAELYKQ